MKKWKQEGTREQLAYMSKGNKIQIIDVKHYLMFQNLVHFAILMQE